MVSITKTYTSDRSMSFGYKNGLYRSNNSCRNRTICCYSYGTVPACLDIRRLQTISIPTKCNERIRAIPDI